MKKQLTILWLALCCAIPALRAQTQTEVQYLSGRGFDDAVEWDFFCTEGQNSGTWTKIAVPSCWEQQGFGGYTYGNVYYGKATAPGITKEEGQYKYEFTVPAEWRGRRVRIVFDGVMTDARVTINGTSAGSVHQGAFYRFKYDISPLLKYGETNVLEVNVKKESDNTSVNMAERRADYWNFGGIFRPVFLESLPPVFIDWTAIDARADGSFLAEIYTASGVAKNYTVRVSLTDAGGKAVGSPITGQFRAGSDKATVTGTFSNLNLWTAETPNLYNVKIDLMDGSTVLHTVNQRTGFRTIEVRRGDGIYVNGTRVILKGINRHSFWPETGRTLNKALNYEDVRLMREMNMNSVRMSHYPPDPEFLDACDELGLYVLDELTGWHGKYDTQVGRKLVAELVKRDVNHPSIIFWDNGNEGGWNTDLDNDFDIYDPQKRVVLHPQRLLNGVETMHYRSYGETQEYLRGENIFLPTEFLHGLYDGGHGGGLFDYWELMRQHPRFGGGYLWDFADQGVVRTDQGGRIDCYTNYAADGIVGPHHEKEASFFTVKEVWSPVVVTTPAELPAGFNGEFSVENRYDFTNLNQCEFQLEFVRFSEPGNLRSQPVTASSGITKTKGPDVTPHNAGNLSFKLPARWESFDAMNLTAKSPAGETLWTWSWPLKAAEPFVVKNTPGKVSASETGKEIIVTAGTTTLAFSRENGQLSAVRVGNKPISFAGGPRFIVARRTNRTLDGDTDMSAPKGVDRIYTEIIEAKGYGGLIGPVCEFRSIAQRTEGNNIVVEASYFGALEKVLWTITPEGEVRLDYAYRYDGVVELMGVCFDYPEPQMQAIRWLGKGPYRSWQNRTHGTTFGVWDNTYNDPIPGESWVYPEFKGYFNDWRWATFTTTEGEITLGNAGSKGSYLGVYTPRDGRDVLLYTLPQTGIAVLDVIPGVRNKVNATDLIGPSSMPQRSAGLHEGFITFLFKAR